jgi:hypothetical protein
MPDKNNPRIPDGNKLSDKDNTSSKGSRKENLNEYPRSAKALKILEYVFNQNCDVKVRDISEHFDLSVELASSIVEEITDYMTSVFVPLKEKAKRIDKTLALIHPMALDIAEKNYFDINRDVAMMMTRTIFELNKDIIGPKEKEFMENVFRSTITRDKSMESIPFVPIRSKGVIDYSNSRELYARFIEAIGKRKLCEVTHSRGNNNNEKTFCFAPLEVLDNYGNLYIQGYLYDVPLEKFKKSSNTINPEERTLALQRVKKVELTDLPIDEKLKITERAKANIFGFQLNKPFTLVVNFDPSYEGYIKERKWPGIIGAPYKINDDNRQMYPGWIKLRLNCGDADEIISWLLGFNTKVAIVNPKWLKEQYSNVLAEMARNVGWEVREKTKKEIASEMKNKKRTRK